MGIVASKTTTSSGMPVAIALPEGEGPHPCVIVLHERFGLVEHTVDVAERFAENGFLGVAPDLYFEFPDQEALHAGNASTIISDPRAIQLLDEVMELIDGGYSADLSRLAVMGVCATGRYPMVYAAKHAVRACVTFYGGLNDEQWAGTNPDLYPNSMEKYLDQMDAPLLGIYGELDHLITIDNVRRLRNALEERNKAYQITIYGDAPHDFLNDTRPDRYRPQTAEESWIELLSFLHRELAQSPETDGDLIEWKFTVTKHR